MSLLSSTTSRRPAARRPALALAGNPRLARMADQPDTPDLHEAVRGRSRVRSGEAVVHDDHAGAGGRVANTLSRQARVFSPTAMHRDHHVGRLTPAPDNRGRGGRSIAGRRDRGRADRRGLQTGSNWASKQIAAHLRPAQHGLLRQMRARAAAEPGKPRGRASNPRPALSVVRIGCGPAEPDPSR